MHLCLSDLNITVSKFSRRS